MIEIEVFKEPKQDNCLAFQIVDSMWELESHNPITGEIAYEKHSGNIYCWVNNEWVQLQNAPEEEYIIEPV